MIESLADALLRDAERARRIAKTLTPEDMETLLAYAAECEAKAHGMTVPQGSPAISQRGTEVPRRRARR
jgi:hypothetical protein